MTALQTSLLAVYLVLKQKLNETIDTQDYPDLYPRQDIKQNDRFRPLPDLELKPAVKEELRKIEAGEAEVPEGGRLIDSPIFQNKSPDVQDFAQREKLERNIIGKS